MIQNSNTYYFTEEEDESDDKDGDDKKDHEGEDEEEKEEQIIYDEDGAVVELPPADKMKLPALKKMIRDFLNMSSVSKFIGGCYIFVSNNYFRGGYIEFECHCSLDEANSRRKVFHRGKVLSKGTCDSRSFQNDIHILPYGLQVGRTTNADLLVCKSEGMVEQRYERWRRSVRE